MLFLSGNVWESSCLSNSSYGAVPEIALLALKPTGPAGSWLRNGTLDRVAGAEPDRSRRVLDPVLHEDAEAPEAQVGPCGGDGDLPGGARGESQYEARRADVLMIKIFTANDPAQSGLMRSALENAGIRAVLKGEYSFSLRGEAAAVPGNSYPTVWVAEADRERARKIVDQFEKGVEGESWTCKKCGTVLEPQFKACWKCSGQS